MRKYLIGAIALVVLALGSVALAAPGSGNRLYCFSGAEDGGYNGTCTLTAGGAVLDNNDGNTDPNDNYAGVYVGNSKLEGRLLGDVDKLAFRYTGSPVVGGSPRFSIPIDQNGDGTTEGYAFVDAVGCSDGAGTVVVIGNASCLVSYGATTYSSWAAFVAANPTYRIGSDARHVRHRRPARRLRDHERRAAAEARQVSAGTFTVGAPPSGGASAVPFRRALPPASSSAEGERPYATMLALLPLGFVLLRRNL